ncbi:hypothetical protein C8J56DRAFT_1087583 [Mycena floridula]|nr:hypothetical protein C8J56DRAFT_1087583 [Mycena floridula]
MKFNQATVDVTPLKPISSKSTKDSVVKAAQALGIDLDRFETVVTLRTHLITYIAGNLGRISTDAKLQPLLNQSYRAEEPESSRVKPTLKSSDKAALDNEQANTDTGTATGVNKALHNLKVSTDPPAQHRPLGAVNIDDDDDSDSGSQSSLPIPARDNEQDHHDEQEEHEPSPIHDNDAVRINNDDAMIVVKLFDQSKPSAIPIEVVVPGANLVLQDSFGHTTLLSELVPAVLENHSPMKAMRGGHIFHHGILRTSGLVDLGQPSKLNDRILCIERFNQYPLEAVDKQLYTCDLFLDNKGPMAVAANIDEESKIGDHNEGAKTGDAIPVDKTDSDSKFPLLVAQKSVNARYDNAKDSDKSIIVSWADDPFCVWLRTVLGSKDVVQPEGEKMAQIRSRASHDSPRLTDICKYIRGKIREFSIFAAIVSTVPSVAPAVHVSVNADDDVTENEMPSLADAWDSDDGGEPYMSDSDSESDDGMPPLIDSSDSDSGYGSD